MSFFGNDETTIKILDGLQKPVWKCDVPEKEIVKNDLVPMPKEMRITNGGQKCDMLIGCCSCGAWHRPEDKIKCEFTRQELSNLLFGS